VLLPAIPAAVFGVGVWAAVADHKAGWTAFTAALGALVGAFGPTVFEALRPVRGSAGALQEAADDLAAQVSSRVRSSPIRARIYQPMPMRVQFRSSSGVGASREAVIGRRNVDWEELPLVGDASEVAARLRQLPLRQLAVLGRPGAGKTVLAAMLVDQLITDRRAGDPVPVLLGLSSLRESESVEAFTVRRLVEDYGISSGVAYRLMAEPRTREAGVFGWWVMPVLDGLDEVDERMRWSALRALDEFAAQGRPLVLTCRRDEYARTEAASGVLAGTAVVDLQPLTIDTLIDFLPGPAQNRRAAWEPVFGELRRHPDGALATALSSPLMAGLAKDVFVAGDPAELVGMTQAQITARLIDGYVAVVYRPRTGRRDGGLRNYRPSDAARWLENIAYLWAMTSRNQEPQFMHWYRLAARPARLMWAQAAATGLLAAAFAALIVRLWASCATALALGALVGGWATVFLSPLFIAIIDWILAAPYRAEGPPGGPARLRRRFDPNFWMLWFTTVTEAWFVVMLGAAVGAVEGDVHIGVVGGISCGLVLFFRYSFRGFWLNRHQELRVRAIRRAVARFTSPGPTRPLLEFHFRAVVSATQQAIEALIVFAVVDRLFGPGDGRLAWTAAVLFGIGRLVRGEAFWIGFRLSLVALAMSTGRPHTAPVPIRLLGFLADGTRPERATFRINGTVWEFRHANIQARMVHTALRSHRMPRLDTRSMERLQNFLREQGYPEDGRAIATSR
jgi:hypothetical protein